MQYKKASASIVASYYYADSLYVYVFRYLHCVLLFFFLLLTMHFHKLCLVCMPLTGPLMVTLRDAQLAGEDYTLSCQATGGGTTPYLYRWFKDGLRLTGETSGTLSFSPLGDTDTGGYTCEVTTGSLTTTSASVAISVVGKCKW